MNTIEEIASVLKKSESAVIFTHTRPDGDTIGSGMALHRALTFLGKKCEVVNDSAIPEKFSFLEGVKEIKRAPTLRADTYVAVDTSDTARLGQLTDVFCKGAARRTTVNIDHHISNPMYAKFNYVDETPSNCENMLKVIRAMGVPIEGDVARFLLLGMVTDSGGFTHAGVAGDTLRAAAVTADGGADVNTTYYETCCRQPKARALLYAEVISNLRFLLDDALVIALVTQKMLDRYGLMSYVTEGFVDFGLTIDGIEVSVCLLEVQKGKYKVSFRSRGKVNVSDVAKTFGGGGHMLASGCMLFGDYEEVCDKLRYAVWQYLGSE